MLFKAYFAEELAGEALAADEVLKVEHDLAAHRLGAADELFVFEKVVHKVHADLVVGDPCGHVVEGTAVHADDALILAEFLDISVRVV